MAAHRGIQILEEIIGNLHPGSSKPAPIKRYSCTVNGVPLRGTLDDVKRRIDEVLGSDAIQKHNASRPHR
ncbi:MAG: hypothetical protein K8T91_02575 [Planctomycetes bacterium]|nr:hypothetical protein [Planctomycetota bacterium]